MARVSLNCSCGWNFFVPGTTPGHEVACPSCAQPVRIPGRKPGQPVPTSAGAIALEVQQKQRTIKMLVGVGVLVVLVAGGLLVYSVVGKSSEDTSDVDSKKPPKVSQAPRPTAPPIVRPTTPAAPPPLYNSEQIEGFRREIIANIWLNNMTGLISECMRYRNNTNDWGLLQAEMTRYDLKIKHDLGELAKVGEKFPLEPYLLQGDEIFGFVDRELSAIKPPEASQFLQDWLKGWQASPSKSQVNFSRGGTKMTLYVEFPEATKELLLLLRHPALAEPIAPAPGSTPDLSVIPAELLKDIQARFDALPPGYRLYLVPSEKKRFEDLALSKRGSPEDINWLRNRILDDAIAGFQQEADKIRSKVLELEVKLKEFVATDVLHFKDGRKPLECQVLQETDEIVKVRNRNVAVTYQKEEILRVEKGKGVATQFPARNAEAKGKLDKLVLLLAWCQEKTLKVEKEYVAYQILLLDATNEPARSTVGLSRPLALSAQPGPAPKTPELGAAANQETLERRVEGIASEVTTQYKIFGDVLAEMRRRTESMIAKSLPLPPEKSTKGLAVISNPLSFKPTDLAAPQALEIGNWWAGMSADDRRDFAKYFGVWCAYMRGLSRR